VSDSSPTLPELNGTLGDLHDRLSIESDEFLSFGYRDPHGEQPTFIGSVKKAETLRNRTFPRDQDCWASINPVQQVSSGRGKASDVTRLAGLFADLDLKPGAFDSQAQMAEVEGDIARILGTNPAAIILSGAGHQPIWAVENGDTLSNADAAALLKRFGLLVQVVADAHGATVDSVFDLPRVLRVPGTNNMKYSPPRPASMILPQQWRPLTVAEVIDALDAHGIAEVDALTAQADVVSDMADWQWSSDKTCSYVTQMIDGWATASPEYGRHQWAGSQCIRLVSAYRLGCITSQDFQRGYEQISNRLIHMRTHRIAGTKQHTPQEEVKSWLLEAKRLVALKSESEVAKELGDHEHENLALKADEEWLIANLKADNHLQSEQKAEIAGKGILNDPKYGFTKASAIMQKEFDTTPLIPRIMNRGQSALLYSESGLGKSLLALEWVVQLAQGGSIFDENLGEPLKIVYIDYENPLHTIQERLESLGVHDPVPQLLDDNLFYSSLGQWPSLATEEGGALLLAAALEAQADLVVIDTSLQAIAGMSENDSETFSKMDSVTTNRLKANGMSVLIIDHAGKDTTKGARGSSAKSASVDQAYQLKEAQAANRYTLTREKTRLKDLEKKEVIQMWRKSDPLRHELATAPSRDPKVDQAVLDLDRLGAPTSIGVNEAYEMLKRTGHGHRKSTVSQAVARRKATKAANWSPSEVIESAADDD
jgi:hypothetical protein